MFSPRMCSTARRVLTNDDFADEGWEAKVAEERPGACTQNPASTARAQRQGMPDLNMKPGGSGCVAVAHGCKPRCAYDKASLIISTGTGVEWTNAPHSAKREIMVNSSSCIEREGGGDELRVSAGSSRCAIDRRARGESGR